MRDRWTRIGRASSGTGRKVLITANFPPTQLGKQVFIKCLPCGSHQGQDTTAQPLRLLKNPQERLAPNLKKGTTATQHSRKGGSLCMLQIMVLPLKICSQILRQSCLWKVEIDSPPLDRGLDLVTHF